MHHRTLTRRRLVQAIAATLTPMPGFAQTDGAIRLGLIESFSGAFANAAEAVHRNILWAVERVNASGGVKQGAASRRLELRRYDNSGQVEDALAALKLAVDDGCRFILQGNSSAVAAALIDAIEKHNAREASRRVLFLNYSAVDPALTNEHCSFWHFRFDAHADMRLNALLTVMKADASVRKVYLIGQDYSFGRAVLKSARERIRTLRPDVAVVGDELHPLGRVKDFAPYVAKINASGADAVVTGNWGNDLTLLVKAAREVGFQGKFYTFYGNALGAPAAIGDAGVGRVLAVADWLPNGAGPASDTVYRAFRARFPQPQDDYLFLRMQLMIQALAQALAEAGSAEAVPVALALEKARVSLAGQTAWMRAADHQFQQSLVVGVMERAGTAGVQLDVEGSGYGFKRVLEVPAAAAELPTTCRMTRPAL